MGLLIHDTVLVSRTQEWSIWIVVAVADSNDQNISVSLQVFLFIGYLGSYWDILSRNLQLSLLCILPGLRLNTDITISEPLGSLAGMELQMETHVARHSANLWWSFQILRSGRIGTFICLILMSWLCDIFIETLDTPSRWIWVTDFA